MVRAHRVDMAVVTADGRHDELLAGAASLLVANRGPKFVALVEPGAVRGAGRDEVGEDLSTSPHTARTHVQRVLRELGVHSSVAAVAMAHRAGMLDA